MSCTHSAIIRTNFFFITIRPPPLVLSPSELPSLLPSPLMSMPEKIFSTLTALLATPEDRTSSCLTRPLRRKLLTNTLPVDVTKRPSSTKLTTERMLCLPSEDVFQKKISKTLLRTLSPLRKLDGIKLSVPSDMKFKIGSWRNSQVDTNGTTTNATGSNFFIQLRPRCWKPTIDVASTVEPFSFWCGHKT